MRTLTYPPAPRVDLVERYHGVPVADPFRRLETADDPATAQWVAAENALTRSALDSPSRGRLVDRLRELHRVPRASVPAARGRRIFFTENDGTKNQAALYVCEAGEPGLAPDAPRVLVDPNALDADGTTAITVFEPDADGARVVYGLSRDGSDAQELLVHDVAAGRNMPDRLQWVKFASIAWWRNGFFYTRYPEPGTVPPEHAQYFCQVWFHRIGDPQAADRLVHQHPGDGEVVFEVAVTSDTRHLIITGRRGASDKADVLILDLASFADPPGAAGQPAAQPLVGGFEAGWHFIDGADGVLYFRTDAGAPYGRIVRLDLDAPDRAPVVIVAETSDTLVDATIADGHLLVSTLHHASSRLTRWTLDGRSSTEIGLPGIGTIVGLAGRWHDEVAYATFTSFTLPPTILAVDDIASRPAFTAPAALPFDPERYVTEQVWYASKDGTKISMFLVHRAEGGDGDRRARPVLLTGYGGFNISLTPVFDASDFLWLDAGGLMAVANLRGGGEYGESWHEAGMRDRKQTVFDDFIAAAEWLGSSGRAAPGRVAIEGGSNGGLLVGAVLVQRPDLFGAVICRVPVADMLRYHRFTVGRFWIPEYGCAEAAGDFPFLLAYSPYHNVRDGAAYPPALVMTADTDDRVAPGMAKKFAARLQEATRADSGPILLRVDVRAGHGAGKPIAKQIEEQADLYAFLFGYMTRTSAAVAS